MDEHRIVGFSSLHRDELDACSPDLQFGTTIDGDVRLEAAYVVHAEGIAEELFVENTRLAEVVSDLLGVIASRVEAHTGIERTEIGVPANVIPVRMCDKDRRQFRQVRRIRSQSLVGRLVRARARTPIDAAPLS